MIVIASAQLDGHTLLLTGHIDALPVTFVVTLAAVANRVVRYSLATARDGLDLILREHDARMAGMAADGPSSAPIAVDPAAQAALDAALAAI